MKELTDAVRTELLLYESPTSLYLPGPPIQAMDPSCFAPKFSNNKYKINDDVHVSVHVASKKSDL